MQYLASSNWKNQPTRVVVTDIQLHSVQAHSALNRLYNKANTSIKPLKPQIG